MKPKPTWLQVFWWQLRTAYHCRRVLGLSWVLATISASAADSAKHEAQLR